MDINVVSPESVGFSSARLGRITAAMQRYIDAGQLPGVLTVVARRGQVVHFECLGMMDVEAGKPMRPDAILRIFSMTKPITAVALMMLFEEGRFLLSDPVSKYIPEFASCRVYAGTTETGVECVDLERPITILDLLAHTAGLAYGLLPTTPVEGLYQAAGIITPFRPLYIADILPLSLPEMVRRLAELPLAHQPGTAWRYSIAYDVIGHLISLLADRPFGVFLQEEILDPLGMDDTGFCVPPDKLDRLAAMYDVTETGDLGLLDAPATSPFTHADCHPSGGGGLVSTAADYLRFAQMLLNGGTLDGTRLLGRKTVARMTQNHLPAELLPLNLLDIFPMPGEGYGLGVSVVVDETQTGMLASNGAYGWVGAAGTRFWVDPREELIALVLPQVRFLLVPVEAVFQNLVYQGLVDQGLVD
jgi:CubicO group peptidase (beta-lactamase class C family)